MAPVLEKVALARSSLKKWPRVNHAKKHDIFALCSDIQKRLKLTLTSLRIFFALPSSKKKCFRVRFAMYTDCSKNDRFCHFMMDFEKMLDFAIKIKFHGATLISLFSSVLKIWI